jgi:hypothetical protein
MSCRVVASTRRLMLPFVSAAEVRSATAVSAFPEISDRKERLFGIRAT